MVIIARFAPMQQHLVQLLLQGGGHVSIRHSSNNNAAQIECLENVSRFYITCP